MEVPESPPSTPTTAKKSLKFQSASNSKSVYF